VSAVVAILVAAGAGARLDVSVPKAFVHVGGASLLVHAARGLMASGAVRALIVVAPPEAVHRAIDELGEGGVTTRAVVAGGADRRESVARGLEALESADEVVAVHDAARPLISPQLVERVLDALTPPWAAVAPALPVVDTLKLAGEDGRVVRTLDRRGLWAVQTPQVFPRDVIEQVHGRSDGSEATDDLVLVERAGGRVRLVEGERRNIKVTYPEDLDLVAAFLGGDAT
jgi:2-C-methyl-D-erythritol 4-phosphate cytidylyltransferase